MPNWVPLEANPEVLDSYAAKLGALDIPSVFRFADVFGLEDDLLAFIPQPVLGVLLLFPITAETEKIREQDAIRVREAPPPPSELFYMKQTIGNACGTIGLLHLLANAANTADSAPLTQHVSVSKDGFLAKFIEATKSMTPEDRGKCLEYPPEEALSIDSIHKEHAEQGATAAPDANADVDLHFAAFVPVNGHLWELDGRKTGPVNHGTTSVESLLRDVAKVVRESFMERAGENFNFSLIALAAADGEGQD